MYDDWKWCLMILEGGKSGRLQVNSVLEEIWKIRVLGSSFCPKFLVLDRGRIGLCLKHESCRYWCVWGACKISWIEWLCLFMWMNGLYLVRFDFWIASCVIAISSDCMNVWTWVGLWYVIIGECDVIIMDYLMYGLMDWTWIYFCVIVHIGIVLNV